MNSLENILGDIDIDTPDRSQLLNCVRYVPAVIRRQDQTVPHNTGVYFHAVPVNPFDRSCSLVYDVASSRGCYKIDILNNHAYDGVRSESHLNQLLSTPPMWDLLNHEEIVALLSHVNNHFDLVSKLKPRSIEQLAMLLALIRPAKRRLVDRVVSSGWHSITDEIWAPDAQQRYQFKKSHAVAYAHAIVVQLNLLVEKLAESCYSEGQA